MGNHARRRLRIALAEAQNWRCAYCACVMDLQPLKGGGHYGREVSLDHILPALLGGRRTRANCIAACGECNRRRGHLDAGWFYTEIQRVGVERAYQRATDIIATMNRDLVRAARKLRRRMQALESQRAP